MAVSTFFIGAALWPLIALLNSTPVRLPLFMELDVFRPDARVAEALAGLRLLETALIFPAALIAVYKFVTGDLPRRIGLPISLCLFLVFADSVLFSFVLAATDVGWTTDAKIRLIAPVVLAAQFARYAVIALAAALMTGRRLRWWQLAVLFGLAAAQRVFWIARLDLELVGSLWNWLAAGFAIISICAAMLLPVWDSHARAGRAAGLIVLALIVAGASYAIGAASSPSLLELRLAADRCPDMACLTEQFGRLTWQTFAWDLGWAAPLVLWPLLVRRLFGIGAEKIWAQALEPYPS